MASGIIKKPEPPIGRDYLSGMVRHSGSRGRGSFVEGLDTLYDTLMFLAELDFQELAPEGIPEHKRNAFFFTGYRYFTAALPSGRIAHTMVMALEQAQKAQHYIQKRAGLHGEELYLEVTGKDWSHTADQISLVVQKHPDGDFAATWYPGEFMAPLPESLPAAVADWKPHWPVKIIRGRTG
ncbi:MAG: hypothetical protein HS115_06130 [Spirochaetales bacterium]|nr:hypothetical protein [Spirochaetales bacterium]